MKLFWLLVTWVLLLALDSAVKSVATGTGVSWPRKKRALLMLAFLINSLVVEAAIQNIRREYTKQKLVSAVVRFLARMVIALGLVTNSASYLITSKAQYINDLAKLGFLILGSTQMIGLSLIATYTVTKSRILTPSPKLTVQAVLIGILLTLYGVYNCHSDWEITRIPLKMPHFRANLRAVFISDIHIGGAIGERDVALLVAKINTLQPDLVLIGGDLIDLSVEEGIQALAHLRNLTPPRGVYFAPGNHDYKSDIGELVRELDRLGVKSLLNERVRVMGRGEGDWFYLAGVEDLGANRGHKQDIDRALAGRVNNRETILLAHRPSTAETAVRKYRDINMILCGHTHGGESFPINVLVYLTTPYFAGAYQCYDVTGCEVVVSVGAMYYNIPIRHIFKREILLVTIN